MRIQLLAVMMFLAIPGIAQQQPPCSSPEYRQFDFWVGEWDVVNPKGDTVGRSRIERIEGGCAILENYSNKKSYTGRSFNIYNGAKKQWQQFWIDNQGGVLEFAGMLVGNELRYTAESESRSGTIRHKMTFFHISRERVRQLWEQSTDKGATWKVVFDGMYHRVERL